MKTIFSATMIILLCSASYAQRPSPISPGPLRPPWEPAPQRLPPEVTRPAPPPPRDPIREIFKPNIPQSAPNRPDMTIPRGNPPNPPARRDEHIITSPKIPFGR